MNGVAATATAAQPSALAADRLLDWINTVDHKKIGIMYMLMAMVFFVVGGLEALTLRVQLALPGNGFVSPDLYKDRKSVV